MRHKITDIEQIASDLPELTDKQYRFVEGLLAGKTASDAYRAAYECSNSANETIWAKASALANDDRVRIWLSAARKAGLGTAKITLQNHLNRLERLAELAIEKGNLGAAVQAEQLIGKASGHYTERMEISSTDPLDALKQIAMINPDLAKQLAQADGIEWHGESTKPN